MHDGQQIVQKLQLIASVSPPQKLVDYCSGVPRIDWEVGMLDYIRGLSMCVVLVYLAANYHSPMGQHGVHLAQVRWLDGHGINTMLTSISSMFLLRPCFFARLRRKLLLVDTKAVNEQ